MPRRPAYRSLGGERHRHGRVVHAHPHDGPHRHLARVRTGHSHHHHHGHSHGLVDDSVKRSREGVRAVAAALGILAVTAGAQAVVFALSGSIALLADLIHNGGDALTAIPLGIAFAVRSARAERLAGLAVVAAILISAAIAGVEAVLRLVSPSPPGHLLIVGLAGAIGFAGNWLAARVRGRAGRRLGSPALVADAEHARADAFVSLGVVAAASVVAVGFGAGDAIIGLAMTLVILRITWQAWGTVHGRRH